ncbi:MAG: glycosyltransferase [Bacteroidia bacterium]|nr:glycosyltransferase [Bacteroidia bacterium]
MKLLVILSRFPYPLEKGDKLRAYNQIKELSKNNKIALFAINDTSLSKESIDELKKYCTSIKVVPLSKLNILFNLLASIFRMIPFQVGYFYSKKIQKQLDAYIKKEKPNHIYCQLIRTTEYVKKHKNIKKTLDYMDVFSKGIERRKKSDPFYMKPILAYEHRLLLKYENEIFNYFDNKIIISEQDKMFIPHPKKGEIKVIPNGVDIYFFKPMIMEKKFELLFNGNMNYPPNIESAEYLAQKIMPLVWQKLPQTKLLLSGASPNEKVKALASDKIIVSGWVDDIRENYAQSKILVAPMQISIGLQNKLLEAMAMKIPCVTSTIANNAINAKHNEQIMVANTPQEYANYIVELLNDKHKLETIANNGYHFILEKYNWTKNTSLLEQLFVK